MGMKMNDHNQVCPIRKLLFVVIFLLIIFLACVNPDPYSINLDNAPTATPITRPWG